MRNLKELIELMRAKGCAEHIIRHCILVSGIAYYIATRAAVRGHKIDLDLVLQGALLHDIGRVRTHSVRHGYQGAQILRRLGIDERVVRIVERHVGAGIVADEAERLGMPRRDFVPRTLEEKIVCYADKLVLYDSLSSVDQVISDFKRELGEGHPAIKRFLDLHREIKELIGEDPILWFVERRRRNHPSAHSQSEHVNL